MLKFRKWFLATALVVFLATAIGASAMTTMASASPPTAKVALTGTTDQMMLLTGTIVVTLTDQANDAVFAKVVMIRVNGLEGMILNSSTTMPANIRFEHGVAIVTNTNAAVAGVPSMAAVNEQVSKTKTDNDVAREVTALRISPQTHTTLAAV